MNITVLSTFDVWPARDGGQTRYTSLWRQFHASNNVTILAYDFRNTITERRYRLARHVEVIVPPATQSDVGLFFAVLGDTGLWMHDILCIRDYSFSVEFMTALRRCLNDCDVLVASHPYLAGIAFPLARTHTIKVYEAHNVEYDIKAKYLRGARGAIDSIEARLRQVWEVERLAAQQANHVTAVSSDDMKRIIDLYKISPLVASVVPNGVNVRAERSLSDDERSEARASLGVDAKTMGIIIASSYGPNVESYRLTRQLLHDAGFDGVLVCVGSIGDALSPEWPDVCFEEKVMGYVSTELKEVLLECADFAPHFVFDGAGTNLKLFDYMGYGVPIIANRFGVRGTEGNNWYWPAETVDELREALRDIVTNPITARARAEEGRMMAAEKFDWAAIAADFENRMLEGFAAGSEVCVGA